MATREQYSSCMTPYMKGTGKTKEQRQRDMCIGAKICSSKATTVEEAEQICINQPPKEPKPRRSRSGKCTFTPEVVTCIASNLELEKLTVDNLPARLETAITHCSMGKTSTKPLTYKRFMNSCLKENGAGGDFIKSQAEIRKCQAKWNELRGA